MKLDENTVLDEMLGEKNTVPDKKEAEQAGFKGRRMGPLCEGTQVYFLPVTGSDVRVLC